MLLSKMKVNNNLAMCIARAVYRSRPRTQCEHFLWNRMASFEVLCMNRYIHALLLLCTFGYAAKQPLAAQTEPDPYILSEINKIKAVDNHTHVPKLVGPNEKDAEYDALPCGGYVEPSDDPVAARPDNPLFLEAWQKLFGYRYKDKAPAHVRELLAAKQSIKQKQGDNYPVWVLDQ